MKYVYLIGFIMLMMLVSVSAATAILIVLDAAGIVGKINGDGSVTS